MKTKFHLDPDEPAELVLVPENAREEMLLDLTLKGQRIGSIKKKDNNGGSWILRFDPVEVGSLTSPSEPHFTQIVPPPGGVVVTDNDLPF